MPIPIYTVRVPEYSVPTLPKNGKQQKYAITPSFNIEIPEKYITHAPDFVAIGKKIDMCLKQHFLNQRVVVRVLGSQEHKNKSAQEIIKLIQQSGHDRYDPKRIGDRYENLDGKQIDLFALPLKITSKGEYFKQFLEPFYYWPIHDNGRPVRVDIAIIYDKTKLKAVHHRYKGRENEIKKDGFVFKHPDAKRDALLGIIRIL